jgi:hypothetical protein
MNFDFDDCYWHDSILESIFIDRTDPGNNDSVEIIVKWYEDKSRSKLIFKKAYLFKAIMNFGIIANETIDTAYIAPSDDIDLVDFYKGWNGIFDNVKLSCYIIETLSTGGKIKILAEDVEMLKI